jgi:hypothetical protein
MPDTSDARTRPFADVLTELDKGRVHTELSAQLQDLIARVVETGKGGTLTLTIGVKPMPKADGLVIVTNKVTTKQPEADRADSIYFVDGENNLTRNDPRQQSLPLRGIPTDTQPTHIKEAL